MAALHAFPASAPPITRPRAIFRVRQRTAMTFDVVRECEGDDLPAIDAAPQVFGPFNQAGANAFAAAAVLRFAERHPEFIGEARPFPVTGRRPGQAYSRPLPRDADDEHRLTSSDLGIEARAR